MEEFLLEIAKGFGLFFMNPLLYWFILLLIIVGYKRIKRERRHFGIKVFNLFSEWKDTWLMALFIGFIISIISVGIGIVLSIETLAILVLVSIILSLSMRLSLLSASYTIGITYLLLLISPILLSEQNFINKDILGEVNETGLVILLGIFLIVEAQLLSRTNRRNTFPMLVKGNRGAWIGQHVIQKATIIPFFTLIPTGYIPILEPYWPYLTLGGETYGLLLFPFVIGYKHHVRGSLTTTASTNLASSIFMLAVIVILLAVGSIFLPWLSLIAVLLAILGREFIVYKFRLQDNARKPFYHRSEKGLKILGIIPESPADRLDILVGETILKVNSKPVLSEQQFYENLQDTGAFFKIEILDDRGEIRFVQSALYDGDHHELGLIFPSKPHREE